MAGRNPSFFKRRLADFLLVKATARTLISLGTCRMEFSDKCVNFFFACHTMNAETFLEKNSESNLLVGSKRVTTSSDCIGLVSQDNQETFLLKSLMK